MKKIIDEGIMIPKYYGIAWVDHSTSKFPAHCYPIPINFIVGFWYYWLRPFVKYPFRKWAKRIGKRN